MYMFLRSPVTIKNIESSFISLFQASEFLELIKKKVPVGTNKLAVACR